MDFLNSYSDSIPCPGQSISNFSLDNFSKDFLISFSSLPGRSVRPIVPRWKRVSPEKRMSLYRMQIPPLE